MNLNPFRKRPGDAMAMLPAGPWAIDPTRGLPMLARLANARPPSADAARAAVEAARAEDRQTSFGLAGNETLTDDGVAIVRVTGVMLKNVSAADYYWGDAYVSTVRTRISLRRAIADERVMGVMLVFDSPGGSVEGTAELAAEVRAARDVKPVLTYYEDLGASAAVYVGSQATTIGCNASAVVGSIGVYMAIPDLSKLAERVGIEMVLIRAGEPLKGAGTPYTPIETAHRQAWQREVDTFNDQFVRAVANGRGLSEAKVRELNTGGVWIGTDTIATGLVDHVESFPDAVARLRRLFKTGPGQQEIRMNSSSTPNPSADSSATPEPQTAPASPPAPAPSTPPQASQPPAPVAPPDLSAEVGRLRESNVTLREQNADLREQVLALKAEAERPRKTGVAPVASTAAEQSDGGGDPVAELEERVKPLVAAGVARHEAARRVLRKDPDLAAAYRKAATSATK